MFWKAGEPDGAEARAAVVTCQAQVLLSTGLQPSAGSRLMQQPAEQSQRVHYSLNRSATQCQGTHFDTWAELAGAEPSLAY